MPSLSTKGELPHFLKSDSLIFPTPAAVPDQFVPQVYAATTLAPWMAQQRLFSPQPHYVLQQQFAPPITYQQPIHYKSQDLLKSLETHSIKK